MYLKQGLAALLSHGPHEAVDHALVDDHLVTPFSFGIEKVLLGFNWEIFVNDHLVHVIFILLFASVGVA